MEEEVERGRRRRGRGGGGEGGREGGRGEAERQGGREREGCREAERQGGEIYKKNWYQDMGGMSNNHYKADLVKDISTVISTVARQRASFSRGCS